ncbi:NAD(P)/FAD-dependent oxidoreductase [Spongiibacter sp. KMU-166]|uniref:Pyridine nucleotide-disulfide oxidoreductase domain-containing protein 2 n=1 Tax=Spongiibacter thalassae TaxID=2721624 RepID=A0ABX1GAR0_9GAMM|nr:NAD(P)/FAD-dependent oxidoreductase [Spongiibacter thalassae]NKI16050.1 NAD(P)/FAD-dependent oxidoreductase [Spongiibacter thalassae]
MSDKKYDVAVIGAGHNGLVAANYLVDAGLRVIVIEACDEIGGLTATRYPFTLAPDHASNPYSVDAFFWDSFPPSWELELHNYGLQRVAVDPGHVYLHPSGASIGYWKDASKTIAEIRRYSEQDAHAYARFADVLGKLSDIFLTLAKTSPVKPEPAVLWQAAKLAVRNRKDLKEIGSFLALSVSEIIDERFKHPVVRDAMHATAGATIPNNASSTGICFLWLGTMHRHVSSRPIGGVQAIPNALAKRLQSKGGEIQTGAKVVDIQMQGGRATGVILEDGQVISVNKAVLASCDPVTTLSKLLPSGALPEDIQRKVDSIPQDNLGIGQMKVDVALSGRLSLERHQKERKDDVDLRIPSHMIGTEAGMARTFARSQAGLLPLHGDFSLWPVITTAADPSQGPEGQDSLYIYSAVAPLNPEGGWEARRDEAAQTIIETASEYYEGLKELELDRAVLSNEDIGRLAHVSAGNITHVDMTLSRTGPLRPAVGLSDYKTPIEGLFITGAGTHPGGGITGGPGYVSAKRLLKSIR